MRTTSYDSYLALLQVGFTLPLLLPIMRCALTTPFHPYPNSKERGGIFSVALSVNSHSPDVIWHFVLRSPDFPPILKRYRRLPSQLRPEVMSNQNQIQMPERSLIQFSVLNQCPCYKRLAYLLQALSPLSWKP